MSYAVHLAASGVAGCVTSLSITAFFHRDIVFGAWMAIMSCAAWFVVYGTAS